MMAHHRFIKWEKWDQNIRPVGKNMLALSKNMLDVEQRRSVRTQVKQNVLKMLRPLKTSHSYILGEI